MHPALEGKGALPFDPSRADVLRRAPRAVWMHERAHEGERKGYEESARPGAPRATLRPLLKPHLASHPLTSAHCRCDAYITSESMVVAGQGFNKA